MVLLGSTGSIGRNSLEIAKRFGIQVEVLVAGRNIELLNQQISEFSPKIVVVAQKEDIDKVNHEKVLFGEDGILEAIELSKSEIVLNALVGFTGLKPTLKTLEVGKRLALANKESLVVAGAFLDISKISPIDSEHFGLWYLLNGRPVEKMILTASGGALRDWDISDIADATPQDVLTHPNWKMGRKITVDSASMVNKLFELLEAKWLFSPKSIDGVIERNSIIHSLIEFKDGSTTAHISGTDMKLPIAFALLGEVEEQILPNIDITSIPPIEFEKIETSKYPLWSLKEELLKYPKKGVILNSANDVLVDRFLNHQIKFGDIAKNILEIFDKFGDREPKSIDEVFEIDREIKETL
ncbi:MAG TPA: 1-deoxy-D-xylulose-5-phosphate reductoisomerase [Campylobacterales bacterium]|nr:1-deoxy-D-xylulose-5-phosphate reductoisomerase [Campylobacterales bacterium]HIO70951.1 1-deoxy-D-xylulose-5-phosphate reductoisomerase [Campylobacterales bacterium]